MIDPNHAEGIAEVFKAIAHPLRLRIIELLCGGQEHVKAIAERLDCPQPIVSQQLRILRMKNLVRVERARGHAIYHLGEPRLRQIVECMRTCEIR